MLQLGYWVQGEVKSTWDRTPKFILWEEYKSTPRDIVIYSSFVGDSIQERHCVYWKEIPEEWREVGYLQSNFFFNEEEN